MTGVQTCALPIYNQYISLRNDYPNATIVRTAIDPEIRTIIRRILLHKVDFKKIERDPNFWLDNGWLPLNVPMVINLDIKNLMQDPSKTLKKLISDLNLTLINEERLDEICKRWKESHKDFF